MRSIINKRWLVLALPVISVVCEGYANPRCCLGRKLTRTETIKSKISAVLHKLWDAKLSQDAVNQSKSELGSILQEVEKDKDKIGNGGVIDGYILRCNSAIALVDCLSTYVNNPTEELAYELRHWSCMESYGWFIKAVMDLQKEAKFRFDTEATSNQ